jgi:hypothetical protein
MPIHNWSELDPNLFHDVHQTWTVAIANRLNTGLLPKGYSALIERHDLLRSDDSVAAALASRGNRISIRQPLSRVRSVIEIVSPGNKSSQAALSQFVRKTIDFLTQGVHVLVVDLFPPTPRDPEGIHKAIWDQIDGGMFELPPDKPLTLASYVGGDPKTAYVHPIGYDDVLPDMPAWLDQDNYVPVPLESTYQATWESCPEDMRMVIEEG